MVGRTQIGAIIFSGAFWALVGCHSSDSSNTSQQAGQKNGELQCDERAALTEVGQALLGTYHPTGLIDEMNLTVFEDGTFSFEIYGCDYNDGTAGRWEPNGDSIVLLPFEGLCTVTLAEDGQQRCVFVGAGATENEIRLTRVPGTVVGDAALPFDTLERGAVCAVCGGDIGPSAPPEACTKDFSPPEAPQIDPASQEDCDAAAQ